MDDSLIQSRLVDLALRAQARGGYTFSWFLNLHEMDLLARQKKQLGVPYAAFGGAPGCERRMARFGDAAQNSYEEEFPIVLLHIAPLNEKFSDDLSHRDYLGALMALGFERELLGDIVLRGKQTYLFCHSRIAPYICEQLTQVSRTSVRCQAADQLPPGQLYQTQRILVQAMSPRMDAVIARVFNLSRADSQALFGQGKAFVNDRAIADEGHPLAVGDIVSARGYGRFIYQGQAGVSRKQKLNLQVDLFI